MTKIRGVLKSKSPQPMAPQLEGVETYPTRSAIAAGELAAHRQTSSHKRAEYSRILMEESHDLKGYIIQKRTAS